MRIIKLEFKNFASYGNRIQTIEFEKEKSNLYLITGENGSGKCLSKETKISVDIDDDSIKNEFIKFLQERRLK